MKLKISSSQTAGFTLLEILTSMTIGSFLMLLVLSMLGDGMQQAKLIGDQASVYGELNRFRVGFIRDVAFSDTIVVEHDGRKVTLSGYYYLANPDEKESAGVPQGEYDQLSDLTPAEAQLQRFVVVYTFVPAPGSTSASSIRPRIVRNGPVWDERTGKMSLTKRASFAVASGVLLQVDATGNPVPLFVAQRNFQVPAAGSSPNMVLVRAQYYRDNLVAKTRGAIEGDFRRVRVPFLLYGMSRAIP